MTLLHGPHWVALRTAAYFARPSATFKLGSFVPILMAPYWILLTLYYSHTLLQNLHFTFLHHELSCSICSLPSAWKISCDISQLKYKATTTKLALDSINHPSYLPISVILFIVETTQINVVRTFLENVLVIFPLILSWPHYQDFSHINLCIWLFLWSQCPFLCQVHSWFYSVCQ